MATASSAGQSPAMLTVRSAAAGKAQMRTKSAPQTRIIGGLNAFAGLKAHNRVAALGLPPSTERCFAEVVISLKGGGGGRSGGGALSAQCNAAAEIFKIAAIMNGLVLIGVAVGFVLLRIEASLEEEIWDLSFCYSDLKIPLPRREGVAAHPPRRGVAAPSVAQG